MPAYSFKERFVPFVLDGSKSHTNRNRRKHPAKPGDTLYLYYGLRTKSCKKLREEICTAVHTIIITARGTVFIHRCRLNDADYELIKADPGQFCVPMFDTDWQQLSTEGKNELAWKDGFRPEWSTQDTPKQAFDLMFRFWRLTHDLPFIGDIIYWKPLQQCAPQIEPADAAFCD